MEQISAKVSPENTRDLEAGRTPTAATAPRSAVQFTWYATLKDKSFAADYDDYRLKESPVISRWIFTMILCAHYLIGFGSVMRHDNDNQTRTLIGVGLLRPFFLVMYTYIATQRTHKLKYNINLPPQLMGNLAILARVVISGYALVQRCRIHCDDTNNVNAFCNPVQDQHQLPPMTLMSFVASTIFMPIIFRCHNPLAAYASVIMTFISVCIALAVVDAESIMFAKVFLFGILVLIGIADFERTSAYSFASYMGVEQAVREKVTAENEKRTMAENSNELRRFIGNVAHDLKTPLQAFVSELDYLEGNKAVASSVSGLNSLQSLKSTCSFMTMTINRYLNPSSAYKLCYIILFACCVGL